MPMKHRITVIAITKFFALWPLFVLAKKRISRSGFVCDFLLLGQKEDYAVLGWKPQWH